MAMLAGLDGKGLGTVSGSLIWPPVSTSKMPTVLRTCKKWVL